MNFLTVSGVAATRLLPGSVSAGTAISIGDHSSAAIGAQAGDRF